MAKETIINGITVTFRGNGTLNPEHSLFVELIFQNLILKIRTIMDEDFHFGSYDFEPDEIQDIFLKNPLNFNDFELRMVYIKKVLPFYPPSVLKYKVDISEIIPSYYNHKLLKIFDFADWSKYDDKEKMKFIRQISNLAYRKAAKAEILSEFDCIGKITDSKVGIELAKLLKTVGLNELYAKALVKYGANDILGKIIETGDVKTIYKVYLTQPINIKKAYHPEIIKMFPRMIQYADIDFIKDFESVDEVNWNLFGTEYAPSINLKNAKIDVMIYLIDKLEVEDKKILLDTQIQILSKEKDYEKKILLIEKIYELTKKLN